MHTIQELAAQGKSLREMARQTGHSRNTIKKYLHGGAPLPRPRPLVRPRATKLDPFKDQIRQWVQQDGLLNCQTMLLRLRELGYTGQITQLKDFVQPLRPPKQRKQPVQRYETKPGDQLQFDWGEVLYQLDGKTHKLYGFTAILSYSRMRFITFTKRCDTASMLRCLMLACEAFGGLPKAMLTDRMKNVFLHMEDGVPHWNPQFSAFMAAVGVIPRVCRPYRPQTKGKVERSVGVIKSGFWPGVRFTDLDDLNAQAQRYCAHLNGQIHRTTGERPSVRFPQEQLAPLPQEWAWERWGVEERKVTWDGFVSYDGVLYGLPRAARFAGTKVEVRDRKGELAIWAEGAHVVTLAKRAQSGQQVVHPEQFLALPSDATVGHGRSPLGYQVDGVAVPKRDLALYDQLCGVEVKHG